VNAARRMPFPERQRVTAASLRVTANPTVTFIVGVERRKFEDADPVIRGGLTLLVKVSSIRVGLGFQVTQDRPLKGASLLVN
jgi:hypothetical protein